MTKLILSHSNLVKYISMLAEQTQGVNLNDYNDEDFIEVFYLFFRPWIKKHHGDEIGEYPMSHLIKEHIKEFLDDYKIDFSTSNYYYTSTRLLSYVGKELIKKGAYKLKSLAKPGTFLERYGKKLNYIVETLNLPDFIEIKFEELNPYRVQVSLEINDFEKLLKYPGEIPSWDSIRKELRSFIENYLGLETGKTSLGKLDLQFDTSPNYENYDDWVKTSFTKTIKKEIRELPKIKDNLHSIKLSNGRNLYNYGITIILTFKHHVGWSLEQEIKTKIKDYFKSKGYNSNYLKID
jgi:hypothetical protein